MKVSGKKVSPVRALPWLILAALSGAMTPIFADDLETAFISPPADTKPLDQAGLIGPVLLEAVETLSLPIP